MFAWIWKLLRDRQSTHSPPPVSPVDRASVGRRGEESAVRWLQAERKMRLITRNWRSARGELDAIMEDRGVLVFVEVRARQGAHPRTIFATVNKKKKKLIRQTAKAYLQGLRESPRTIRFDVVAVTTDSGSGHQVFHYEGVPLFGRSFRA